MGRINESVYGTPETWTNNPLNALNSNRWVFGKCPSFGKLEDGIAQNKISINNHIDNTLSWCCLGAESNYNKIDIYNVKNNWNKSQIITENTNFFFYSRPDINFTWNNTDFQINQATNSNTSSERALWSPIPTLASVNKHRFIYPVVDIDLKKLKFLVKVRAATDTTFSTQADFDFNDYKNNHTGDYPIIRKIYAMPYNYNNNNTWGDIAGTGANYNFFGVAMFHNYPTYWSSNSIMYTCFDKSNSNDPDFSIILYGARNNRYSVSANALRHVMSIGQPKYITVGSYNYFYQDDNLNDVLESALKTIACFGVFFCLDSTYIQDNVDSTNTYMGVIPDNFITHGVYTHGSDNRNNNNWNWGGTSESTYDPANVDITEYNKTTGFNAPTVAHSFTKRYVLNAAAVQNLAGELWAAVNTQGVGVETAEFNNKLFLCNNPIDCIISLQKFPLSDIGGGSSEFIKLGAYTSTVVRGRPHTNTLRVIQFTFDPTGTNGFKSKFGGSFLDREPYTNAVLYVPYCGTVTLDPADYIDKTITVTMIIDYITGACTAYIAADGLVMTSIQGSCGIDLPVTGVQEMDLKAQIFNANQQLKAAKNQRQKTVTGDFVKNIVDPTGAGSAIAGMVMGSKGGAAGAAIGGAVAVSSTMPERATSANTLYSSNLSVQNAKYNISHMEVPFKEVGGSSPCTSAALESCCRIIITRPLTKYDPEIYGHTVGYLCNLTGTIKNFHGYAEITAVDLSDIPCTAEEKALIKQALAKGVYLP